MGARAFLRIFAILLLAGLSLSLWSTAASAAGECSNEDRREEQGSVYLPDCRGYEMVSPLDKKGTDVSGQGKSNSVATDGKSVSFAALAGFSESTGSGAGGYSQYIASRQEGIGWATHGITPLSAGNSFQFLSGLTIVDAFSDDMSRAIAEGYELPYGKGGVPGQNYYSEDTSTGVLEPITMSLQEPYSGGPTAMQGGLRGFSRDAEVVTFETSVNLLPGTTGGAEKLYSWNHGQLTLAGILPDGTIPSNGSRAPIPAYNSALENREAVSHGGSQIAFMARPDGTSQNQLYLRRGGASSAWVSQSEASSPNPEPLGVRFESMTPDGRHVLFATTDKLLDSDPGEAPIGLYMYTDSPNPEVESNLSFIARVNVSSEEVFTGMSEDGKRIYFYTAAAPGFSQTGTYLWDEGSVHFIAATNTPIKPLPQFNGAQAEVSADGRQLAFISQQPLTSEDAGGSLNAMYLYDETDETLRCVSCLPTGTHGNSEAAVEPRATDAVGSISQPIQTRFLSDDGRRLFFSTADPLIEADTNGLEDVYEYDIPSGTISLLSPGFGDSGTWLVAASLSGDDVFAVTAQRLVAADTDTLIDLYDIRVDGGFPQPPADTGGCVGDECQGIPAAVPSFNTASGFSGIGNLSGATNKGGSAPRTRAISRAEKLAHALKACKRTPKSRRHRCEAKARKRYGTKMTGTGASRRARR